MENLWKMASTRIMPSPENIRYAVFDRIGSGTYGTVYQAVDRASNRLVAIKEMRYQVSENEGIPTTTLREISLLEQLNRLCHPNVVKLLDIYRKPELVQKEAAVCLVFEFVLQDLNKYIQKHPHGFHINQIKAISRQMLQGVAFLHEHRIMHRDLKPHNILVTHRGQVKLADFGLAREFSSNMALTPGLSTLGYRAPEILLGLPYATAADVWSIGCIIAQLFLLRPLFGGQSEIHQLLQIVGLLGKPPREDWPESTFLKWDSFQVNNSTTLKDLCWDISEEAFDLIMNLLKFNQFKRMSAAEAVTHKFLTEYEAV